MEVMKGRSSLQYNRKMGSTGEVIELLDKKKKSCRMSAVERGDKHVKEMEGQEG